MKKRIRWLSVFLAISILFATFNLGILAEEDQSSDQTEEDSLVADYPEGVVESHPPSLSTEEIETGETADANSYYAEITDGVYAIMSFANLYRWITIENDSPWENANVQQVYSETYPASTSGFDRTYLFKISRVGTTERYIIRSMINNCMTIHITSDGRVITKKIDAADSLVDPTDTFVFEEAGAGYYIHPYAYGYYINMASTDTANLSTTYKTDPMPSSAKWVLVRYVGTGRSGMTLYRPTSWGSIGNVVGNTSEATLVGWSTYINANTLSMDITSGYEDLGTLSWDASTNKMTLLAENPGQIRINARIKYGNGTEVYSGYFSHMIVPQEGTYYIQNAGTERYIDLESASMLNGAIIQQWQFHTQSQEKWIIEHISGSGGYVRIKSLCSNLYIGIDSSNTASVRQYSTQNNYTLWKIDRSSVGNLIFTCKATEDAGIVLSVPLNANANGTDLTQITYTNDANKKDEWYLIKKVISYVNYYDTTFVGNSTMIQNIAIANSFANVAYARYFNVGMYNDGPASQYATIADNCSTGTNSPCSDATCGLDCSTTHHKNVRLISDQIYNSPREADHIYVLWANRNYGTYCDEKSGVHTPLNAIASVTAKRPVIIFKTIAGDDENQRLACMALNLVHETAHTFKMYEVYDNTGHDVDNQTICVMERFDRTSAYNFYEMVLSGLSMPFCPSCAETMKIYTSNITIKGN